jgi:hypothetical protein
MSSLAQILGSWVRNPLEAGMPARVSSVQIAAFRRAHLNENKPEGLIRR